MTSIDSSTTFRPSVLQFVAPSRTGAASCHTLSQTIQGAVQGVEEGALHPVGPQSSVAMQPRIMLAVMTYCYARKIYSSAEIHAFMAADAPFCHACQNDFPDARTLRQFRDANRQVLRHCLVAALSFLAAQKVEAGFVTRINELRIAEEATRRLIRAMWLDTIAADDSIWAGRLQ
jgi:hypothetical protein